MTWEFGSSQDFSKLVEYEWQLEELFHRQPALSGICQYHTDTLSREATRQGLVVHPSIFMNETLSLINPNYIRPGSYSSEATRNGNLDAVIDQLCRASAG